MSVILVVEDDTELQNVLRLALEEEGLRVDVAIDGRRAMEWVTTRRPSLVVLDWGLPDMSGGVVARHIREVHGPDVPILLLTADGRGSSKAAQVGAYAFLPKPFDLDELIDVIHRGTARA